MSEGDPNNPQRGRAQVPGSSGGSGSAAGRASAGRASVGRASVGGGGARAAGVGRASVGRAGVAGGASGAKAGRAQVPVRSGTIGRATVGRPDVLENRGPAQRPPKSSKPTGAAAARAKRARRRNLILGAFALLIIVAGGSVVGGTYFYDDVDLPKDLPQSSQVTTVFYSDGQTQMAKIGDENRTIVPSDQIPKDVKNAVVATENKAFYTDQGISYTGILRAAWNNFTGGQRQGASTITQQYARAIADLKGITYSRKLREAVLAMKLSKTYTKDQILTAYLNTVPFGRSTNGIEAAAEAYFGKHAKELNVAEGMALAAMIKSPAGGPDDLSYYDGTVSPGPALDRFNNYIKPNMVQMKFITPEQAATLKYPEMKKYDPNDPAFQAQWGLNTPEGNILHNVMDELYHMKDPKGNQMFPDLKTGGYRIVTTIDKDMQAAAVKYADNTNPASPLYNQKGAVGALVSVEPYSGRVRAYYGGPNGGSPDLAGVWRDPVLTNCGSDEPNCDKDRLQGFGRHYPASSFKIYTLGAALREGISLSSYWDGTSGRKFPERQAAVVNAEGNTNCAGGDKHCTLAEATAESLNVPFYSVARTIGADKVLDFAKNAGIRYIWNLDGQPQVRSDLSADSPKFSPEIGIGQYAVTVLDHANGVATIAARGARAPEHFVAKVYKGADLVYSEAFKPTQIPGYTQAMADDEASALQKVLQIGTGKGLQLKGGRQAAAKTGTWQASTSSTDFKNNGNSNAWMVGFIAPDLKAKQQFYGLATAVWVGSSQGDATAVKINGQPLFGSTGPGPIWKKFMDASTGNMPMTKFPPAKNTGDPGRGDSTAPAPTQPPADPNAGQQQPGGVPCLFPFQQNCQPGGQAGGRGGNGNGNGTGNGGQGGGLPVTSTPTAVPSRRP